MKLEHTVGPGHSERTNRKTFATALVLATGLAYLAVNSSSSGRQMSEQKKTAHSDASCDSVFTEQAKAKIEKIVEGAISSGSGGLKGSLEGGGFLNIAVGVGKNGAPQVEDIWSYPEPNGGSLDAKEIVESIGRGFGGMKLAAPQDGTRCSYTVPVKINI